MIERDFVSRNKMEFQIQEFISSNLKGVGLSYTKLQRTPLGEKIIIYASRPGLIIGGGGTNIKKLTKQLKKKFGLENPQIEISEVENVNLVSAVVGESAPDGARRGRVRSGSGRPTARGGRDLGGAVFLGGSVGDGGHFLPGLLAQSDLAAGSRRVLSGARSRAGGAGAVGRGSAGGGHRDQSLGFSGSDRTCWWDGSSFWG